MEQTTKTAKNQLSKKAPSMLNSQLVQVCHSLTKKEVRDLKKWLQSPAHNQRADVVDLFAYLMQGDHLFQEKFLEKERIFQKVFPGEPYDDARLRQTFFFTLKAIEDFLSYQHLISEALNTRLALAKTYRHKKLDKPYQKRIREVEKLQEAHPFRDENFLISEYLIEMERYEYLSKQQRTKDINLQKLAEKQEHSFISGKLRIACYMLSHQRVYKTEYDFGMLANVLHYVSERAELLEVPAIRTYYYCYLAFSEPRDTAYFSHFKDAIFRYVDYFSQSEIRDLYLLAVNYCISKSNEGVSGFMQEAFELFKNGIAKKVFIENGILDHRTFRNVSGIAMNLKEFAWTESFIEKYRNYLPSKYKTDFVEDLRAQLYRKKGDLEKARQIALQISSDDPLINLNTRWMLVTIYYQEDELELLENQLENMKTYLNRKKVLAYHKTAYTNLIQYTRKLIRVNPFDRASKEKLRREIAEANPLIGKDWFFQQLDRL